MNYGDTSVKAPVTPVSDDGTASGKTPKAPTEAEAKLMAEARTRFDRAYEADLGNREAALDDLQFLGGEQWPDWIRQQREHNNRPVLTINRLPALIGQVTGNLRKNRPAVRIRPAGGGADPETANVYAGLIRSIESQSDASIAYQHAADCAAACGLGWFRIRNEWAEPTAIDQDLVIEPVWNPFAVYCDPDARHPTRRDARWMFVTDEMDRLAFEEDFPDAAAVDFDGAEPLGEMREQWYGTGDVVRVAEYWWKVPETRLIGETSDGQTFDVSDWDETWLSLAGVERVQEVPGHCLYHCLMTGQQMLEPPRKWPGRWFPMIAVAGQEIHMGERVLRHGVVRFAKDAQRRYNYSASTHAELVGLQPKAPYLLTPEEIQGHEQQWERANVENTAYLLHNLVTGMPSRPGRAAPPQPAAGLLQEIALSAEDMKATTGIFDAAQGNRSNETSGRAIRTREEQSDDTTSIYPDNQARAIRQAGRVLLDLIPVFYDGPRTVRILGEDDAEKEVRLLQDFSQRDRRTGKERRKFIDLAVGKYDVVVSTGPNYQTRRQEAVDGMLGFVQASPDLAGMVMDLVAKNMDWPGAEEVAERIRKTMPPELVEKDDEEEGPDPRQIMQQMAQQLQQLAQELELGKKRAEAREAEADVQGKVLDNREKALELAAKSGQLEELVRASVADVLAGMFGGGGPATPQPGPVPAPSASGGGEGPVSEPEGLIS